MVLQGGYGSAGPQSLGYSYAIAGHLSGLFASLFLVFSAFYAFCYSRKCLKDDIDRAFWTIVFISAGYLGYSDLAAFKASGGFYVVLCCFLVKLYYALSSK